MSREKKRARQKTGKIYPFMFADTVMSGTIGCVSAFVGYMSTGWQSWFYNVAFGAAVVVVLSLTLGVANWIGTRSSRRAPVNVKLCRIGVQLGIGCSAGSFGYMMILNTSSALVMYTYVAVASCGVLLLVVSFLFRGMIPDMEENKSLSEADKKVLVERVHATISQDLRDSCVERKLPTALALRELVDNGYIVSEDEVERNHYELEGFLRYYDEVSFRWLNTESLPN